MRISWICYHLQFLGNWYVLEYQYARKMRTLRDIGCVQLHYTALGVGDIISNFTFRYPPRTGFFFHVAEISLLSDVQPSVWETQYGTSKYKMPRTNRRFCQLSS